MRKKEGLPGNRGNGSVLLEQLSCGLLGGIAKRSKRVSVDDSEATARWSFGPLGMKLVG